MWWKTGCGRLSACPPGPIPGGAGACPPELRRRLVPPVIPPNPPARRRCHQEFSENSANDSKSRAGEPACTFGGADKPGVLGGDLVFDAGKLHSQLADLLQIYLKRAAEPDAVQKCSAKDAISCAKTLTAMMSDVQSGKPASVDADAEWPRLGSSSVDTLLGCQGFGS